MTFENDGVLSVALPVDESRESGARAPFQTVTIYPTGAVRQHRLYSIVEPR
jgi:hypothetical protein